VTSRGNERKEIFKSDGDREKFLFYLASATERYGALFHAYCLMTNHYHLMIETPQGNLSRIMKHINNSYTNYYNVKHKRAGHLLQGRYKAILVEADTYAAELSRYIHLNPVRAKMVEAPEDHPWTSYRSYVGGSEPSWLSTGFILGYFGEKDARSRKNYASYVRELAGREYASPLLGAAASTILGGEEFVRRIQEKQLKGKEPDRDLPALKELVERRSPEEIRDMAVEAFAEIGGKARGAGVFLCHRYSGARLKEIGELFGLSQSGVTQASRRFEEAMKVDESLRVRVKKLEKDCWCQMGNESVLSMGPKEGAARGGGIYLKER